MNQARHAIVVLSLAVAALAQGACAAETLNPSFFSYGGTGDYYGQTTPYQYQYRDYQYRDPYTFRRPYGYGGTQGPYWNSPQSRVFSPDSGVKCDRRKEVCYKWHNNSREWRPDRSDTKDTFGKKAARRINQ